MGVRDFAGGAKRTKLSAAITSTSTTINVVDGAGYPTGAAGPFAIAIDVGLAGEEKVLVATRTGNTLTVAASGRGYDGTTATAHSSGDVDHVITAVDVREANAHVNDTTTGDPHPQYLNTAEGNAAYVRKTGGDVIAASGPGVVPLTSKAATGQTAALHHFKSATDVVMLEVNLLGGIKLSNFGTGTGPTVWGGSGVPSNGLGSIGDYYFRSDQVDFAGSRIYVKASTGVWGGTAA